MSIEWRNGVVLHGDPERGILAGIGPLKWKNERPLWRIKVREGAVFRELPPEAFETLPGGVFLCRELPLRVTLSWRPGETGEAICTLGFEAEEGGEVAELGFRAGGLVRVAGEGEEDILYYPFATGLRIPSPAKAVFEGLRRYDTQYGPGEFLRHLNVIRSGLPAKGVGEVLREQHKVERELTDYREWPSSAVFEWGLHQSLAYPGGCSMTWLHYAGRERGIALSVVEPGLEKAFLHFRAERGHAGIDPGITRVFNRPLASWRGDFILAQTGNDWRETAQRYRRRLDGVLPPAVHVPPFFAEAPGVITHYDLKWEDGTIHHRYADLPRLSREARELGFSTLLLAGWNRGGFDNFELNYQPDSELGTETELREAIETIHREGGRVILYVNVQCIAADGADFAGQGAELVVRHADGSPDRFGEEYLAHPLAVLCPEAPAWRAAVKRNIRYGLLELGADGLYLDQIGSAPRECYGAHRHGGSWVSAYRSLLTEVRSELAAAGQEYVFITEYPMDAYRDLIDGFLCYSYWQAATDLCYPALFRETLPEVQLLDMTMQKPWRGRHAVESEFAAEIFCRQFIEGLKYWTYCHAPGNPALAELFPMAVRLRNKAWKFFAEGRELGDRNLAEASPGLVLREFRLGERRLFAIWNPREEEGWFTLQDEEQRIPVEKSRLILVEV